MDQHLGASITLSFALVVFFAIVFYQPDQPPTSAPVAAAAEVVQLEPAGPDDDAMPPLTPAEPVLETSEAGRTGLPSSPAPPSGEDGVPPSRSSDRPSRPERASSSRLRRDKPGRPAIDIPKHDGFTMAIEGETLKDVALRVYGASDDDAMLWRLNRDLLGAREGPLSAGTLLRTP
jgi:hypothetical protein